MKYILIIGAVALLVWVLGVGIDRQERSECIQWAEQGRTYPNWYATEWQEAQCEAQGIKLN